MTKIRKTLVIMALIFLIVGIFLAVFSTREPYTEENTFNEWDTMSRTLSPDSEPGWTLEMPEGSLFELNVSGSDTVRVRIGIPHYDMDTGEEIAFDSIYDQVGTSFTQDVVVDASGLYRVEIRNEGTIPVSIWGNVLAKTTATKYRATSYPYAPYATPLVLVGVTLLIYGILTKPKKPRAR